MQVEIRMRTLITIALLATAASPLGRSQDGPAGDTRRIEFLPFDEALAKAKAEKRLLFLKPIYGGVDEEGARDYRCGSW